MSASETVLLIDVLLKVFGQQFKLSRAHRYKLYQNWDTDNIC